MKKYRGITSWLTKTVEAERVVVRTRLGNPEKVTVYRAYEFQYVPALYTAFTCMKILGYYHSCAQALVEHPKANVDAVELLKVGNVYLKSLDVVEVKVQPKPKRGKGKAGAAA